MFAVQQRATDAPLPARAVVRNAECERGRELEGDVTEWSVKRSRVKVCYLLHFGVLWFSIMKINENTLLEGRRVVLVPYNADHVPR